MLVPGIYTSKEWKQENKIIFSSLHHLEHTGKQKSTGIGIKYVMQGTERYCFNRKTYTVKEGNCLLVNEGQLVDVFVDHNDRPVNGICVYLSQNLLQEVFLNESFNDEWLLKNFMHTKNRFDVVETIYQRADALNDFCAYLGNHLDTTNGSIHLCSNEIFYELAKKLLQSQSITGKKMNNISASRAATKRELFKRVNEARLIIHDRYAENILIEDLAATVALSEFHFFRTFKQAFGRSPHQYQIGVRLESAKQMMLSDKKPLSEIAEQIGFPDVQSFSKSFKAMFGITPGQLKNKRNFSYI